MNEMWKIQIEIPGIGQELLLISIKLRSGQEIGGEWWTSFLFTD